MYNIGCINLTYLRGFFEEFSKDRGCFYCPLRQIWLILSFIKKIDLQLEIYKFKSQIPWSHVDKKLLNAPSFLQKCETCQRFDRLLVFSCVSIEDNAFSSKDTMSYIAA